MGLIARLLEASGLHTLCFSAAHSITKAVNPPRSVFLDFPLGQTCGKPDDASGRLAIMRAALRLVETLGPSEIATLPFNYGESDDWKDTVMRPKATATGEEAVDDFRTDRFETPQYQERDDELAADPNCSTCIFVE